MSWSEKLLPASFKGVEFDIEAVSDTVQRATVANEYPYRDGADIEDLGLGPQRMRFSAIVFNARPRRGDATAQDDYEQRLQQLIAVLRSGGPGRLVHPVFGNFDNAVCTSWAIEHEAEFRDGCKISLEFVESRTTDRIFTSASPVSAAEQVSAKAEAARSAADAGLIARVQKVLKTPVPRQLQLRSQMQAALGQLRALVDTTALKQRLSELDPLFYPQSYVADARNVLDRALQGLPFGGRNILFSGKTTGSNSSSKSASGLADFERAAAALRPTSLALLAPDADSLMVQAHARTHAGCCLAEAASIVLMGELDEQLLDATQVESIAAVTREALQAAVADLRSASGTDAAGAVAAASAALRATAFHVQEAATAVVELRPPVQLRTAPVTGPLRLVAHALYGDHTRAVELQRLNVWGRRLVVERGEQVKAYAR
ncbi:MAG: DNA circularization N-terminal domain-containing protein [Rubrivivax sp.]